MVGRREGLGGGATPSSTSGQSALSEAGWSRAAVCTGRGTGGPAGDLATMADPQHRAGRQGLRSTAVAAGAGRVWPFTGPTGWAPGLAESQPAGPQGGLRPVCWGPGAGWPKHPQGIGQNRRPQANARGAPPHTASYQRNGNPRCTAVCGGTANRRWNPTRILRSGSRSGSPELQGQWAALRRPRTQRALRSGRVQASPAPRVPRGSLAAPARLLCAGGRAHHRRRPSPDARHVAGSARTAGAAGRGLLAPGGSGGPGA